MQLGYNEIMIVSKYFKDINDFINLEMGVKRFRGNMERFHFNPIPLNQYSRKLFPNIETFHIYNKEDEIFKDGKIFKYVIWYKVEYSRYLEEKEEMNEYKNIAYTEEDRNTYGNTIPIEVNSLEDFCFYRCNDIQSIEIPTSVIEIGNGCFYECSSLTTINIPTSVIEIGNSCFEECSSLISLTIEDVKYISEERIFMNEPMLISIEIPKNLKIINGKNIEKKDINEFNIPSTITKLGDSCFSECYSLTTIEILTSVIEIGKYCFVGCSLTTINIPSSITSFGYGLFLSLWM
ncbi:leucine rich repeat protein bspa family [Entamoeba histolytica]|uniref:Leucine rich repeat protein bspa family n=1 Tax=Entamoeba histolytica TaxID=5759 RepID=A0A175K0Z6_ENTHI|nr:leucine rich repeat protein bspa family [Entamoeba histolytica]